MFEMIALALVLSVFGATVSHLLGRQLGSMGGANAVTPAWTPANRLRRVRPEPDESVPDPTWASFPRAF